MLTEEEIAEIIARIKEGTTYYLHTSLDLREQAVSISKVSGVEKRRKIVLKSSAFVHHLMKIFSFRRIPSPSWKTTEINTDFQLVKLIMYISIEDSDF